MRGEDEQRNLTANGIGCWKGSAVKRSSYVVVQLQHGTRLRWLNKLKLENNRVEDEAFFNKQEQGMLEAKWIP